MLTIVITKPMLLTMVKAVPFISAAAFWALKWRKVVNLPRDHSKKAKCNKYSFRFIANGHIKEIKHKTVTKI
jgi:hypothetical protein